MVSKKKPELPDIVSYLKNDPMSGEIIISLYEGTAEYVSENMLVATDYSKFRPGNYSGYLNVAMQYTNVIRDNGKIRSTSEEKNLPHRRLFGDNKVMRIKVTSK